MNCRNCWSRELVFSPFDIDEIYTRSFCIETIVTTVTDINCLEPILSAKFQATH